MSHQWSPSYTLQVVEQAFGVVDGGIEHRVWYTPLTIQIFAGQITASPEETQQGHLYIYYSHSITALVSVGVTLWCVCTIESV